MIQTDRYIVAVDLGGTNLVRALADQNWYIFSSASRPVGASIQDWVCSPSTRAVGLG